LDFQVLLEQWHRRSSTFRPLARFPAIERDLAVVLRQDISTGEVVEQIRRTAPELIESVDLFDLYQGDQIAAGHKSLAFSLRLRSPEKTLKDEQANQIVDKVLKNLKKAFDADLRLH
jgi:phenylalanyl-tRNA synthetase beta chain